MQTMGDGSVELTVTSPPYDNLRDYNGYLFDFNNTANELFRITKDGGVVVWIVGDSTIDGDETGTSFKHALYFKEIGFKLHDTMIYEKINYMPVALCGNRYASAFEYMFILTKNSIKTTNLLTTTTTCRKRGFRYNKSGTIKNIEGIVREKKVIENIWGYYVGAYGNDDYKTLHPASFPEQLAIDHVVSWSNASALIFDPFAGSFTTAIACIRLGRKFIGCELSPEYYEIGKKRIRNELMQTKLEL
jgi:site-specific DNA-methyltransferase (adenine-specific)